MISHRSNAQASNHEGFQQETLEETLIDEKPGNVLELPQSNRGDRAFGDDRLVLSKSQKAQNKKELNCQAGTDHPLVAPPDVLSTASVQIRSSDADQSAEFFASAPYKVRHPDLTFTIMSAAKKRSPYPFSHELIRTAAHVHYHQLQTIMINAQKACHNNSKREDRQAALVAQYIVEAPKWIQVSQGLVPVPKWICTAELDYLCLGAQVVGSLGARLIPGSNVSLVDYVDSRSSAEGSLQQTRLYMADRADRFDYPIQDFVRDNILQRELVCDWYESLPFDVPLRDHYTQMTAGNRHFVSILRQMLTLLEGKPKRRICGCQGAGVSSFNDTRRSTSRYT